MQYTGYLNKMAVHHDAVLQYYLNLENDLLHMNKLIGKTLALSYQNHMQCFCGKKVDKVFRQNFCYSCFYTLPQASDAIMKPELSQAHLGIEERDLEWEKSYQLQPHVVYLAYSGGLKVGVTRSSQKLTRWADQGADAAIVLADTPHRQLAGMIEVALKNYLSDKTNWRNMLISNEVNEDLTQAKKQAVDWVPQELAQFLSPDDEIFKMNFPTTVLPKKVQSVSLEKEKSFTGVLTGIKGQYLIFESGAVLNVRSQTGKAVSIEWV